ncbi:MAG: hypothetical protein IPN79_19985 [Saprospiraceae bacterium]|nr:hypothetical protein [Saprospiraceae bacterium]
MGSTDRKGNFEIRHFTEVAGLQAADLIQMLMPSWQMVTWLLVVSTDSTFFDPAEILIDTIVPDIFITKLIVGNQVVNQMMKVKSYNKRLNLRSHHFTSRSGCIYPGVFVVGFQSA